MRSAGGETVGNGWSKSGEKERERTWERNIARGRERVGHQQQTIAAIFPMERIVEEVAARVTTRMPSHVSSKG